MATINFNQAYSDATKGATLKALQLRQQQAEQEMVQQMRPRQISDPLQGVAQIAGTIGAGIREGRAAAQEQAGRQQMAQLLAGGLKDPQSMAQAMMLDPETASKYQQNQWDVAAAAARVQAEQKAQEAGFTHADVSQQAGFTHADVAQQAGFKQAETTAETLAKTEAERAKTLAGTQAEAAALQDPVAQANANLAAGRISPEEHDAIVKKATYVSPTQGMTPGQIKTDTDMAANASRWVNGGAATATAQLANIQNGLDILKKSSGWDPITGPIAGGINMLPGVVSKTLNPEAYKARDSIVTAVQNSAKEILGTQYSAREGDQLFARAFDINLPPDENIRRATAIQTQLASMVKAKQEMIDYYYKNQGSMAGFKYQDLDTSELDRLLASFDNPNTTTPASTAPASISTTSAPAGGAAPAPSPADDAQTARKKKYGLE